jgi:AcrR family transcriptional regulator
VATGNAYYYLDSKEELVQEYYARNQADHAVACRPVLDAETRLGARLRGVLRALIDGCYGSPTTCCTDAGLVSRASSWATLVS